MTYTIAVCTVKKIPDDGQFLCPKYVEFYSKNKFEKLVHVVGFIIIIYHDARSPERQIGKDFPVHTMKSQRGIRRKTPFIRTFGIRWG
jgi:hypothetical protein